MVNYDGVDLNRIFNWIIDNKTDDPFVKFATMFGIMQTSFNVEAREEEYVSFSAQRFARQGKMGFRRIDRALDWLVEDGWLQEHPDNVTSTETRAPKKFLIDWGAVRGEHQPGVGFNPVRKAEVKSPRLLVVVGDVEGEPFSEVEYPLADIGRTVVCPVCGRRYDQARMGGQEEQCARCDWKEVLLSAVQSGAETIQFYGNTYTSGKVGFKKQLDALLKGSV